jgi:hypothetical protein
MSVMTLLMFKSEEKTYMVKMYYNVNFVIILIVKLLYKSLRETIKYLFILMLFYYYFNYQIVTFKSEEKTYMVKMYYNVNFVIILIVKLLYKSLRETIKYLFILMLFYYYFNYQIVTLLIIHC